MLAGHCHVGNRVSIMGGGALHHFVSVGDLVFIGGYSRVRHDIPPYFKLDGDDQIRGLNVVGLRRAGISEEDIEALEMAGRRLFYAKDSRPMSTTMTELLAEPALNPRVRQVVDMLRRRSLAPNGRYLESLRRRS
jgi:UDP-N-acetylglucosamine acyltransferase